MSKKSLYVNIPNKQESLRPHIDKAIPCPYEQKFDIIKDFFELEFKEGLIILPTATEILSNLNSWQKLNPSLAVVAPITGGTHTPSELLKKFSNSNTKLNSAIILSDQLVFAQEAPIPVKKNNRLIFLSAVELIAQKKYGTYLHIWQGRKFETLGPATPQLQTLNSLTNYLDSCDELGPKWQARADQANRHLKERRRNALHRLRLFQSMILHSSIKSMPNQKIEKALEKISELQKATGKNDEI